MRLASSPIPRAKLHVFDLAAIPWTSAGAEGLYQKIIRLDDDKGQFLGAVAFDPFVRSRTHQHLDVATSYVLEGGLSDYQGTISCGEMGINLAGATHDAISYARTVLVSRLEGPVIYPEPGASVHRLHAGARASAGLALPALAEPDINIVVDGLPQTSAGFEHASSQLIYDYFGTRHDLRLIQLRMLPNASAPAHVINSPYELFVKGGSVEINGARISAGSLAIIEPGRIESMKTEYGCYAIVWADGPAYGDEDGRAAPLYG